MTLESLFDRRALGIRLELETLGRVHGALGSPGAGIPALHIVGTNGKGSIAAMAGHALRGHGYRVGLYTSPHLQRVTERVRVDGVELERGALEAAVGRVLAHETPDLPRPLSFFEVLTLAALCVFEDARVEVLVAEAGMGGRWDATRCVSARAVAVASIGMDHEAWLGSTLAAIAAEKAAVFRRDIPVISGPQEPEVQAVLEGSANAVGAPLRWVEPLVAAPDGLPGGFQRTNAAVALAAARCFAPQLQASALDGTRWPGRLERHAEGGGTLVFDVAHNVPGARALRDATIGEGPWVVVAGCQADKDSAGIVAALADLGSLWWVELEGGAPAPNAAARTFASPEDAALAEAIEAALAEGLRVLICGSHRLVGAARTRWLGGSFGDGDPSDPRR